MKTQGSFSLLDLGEFEGWLATQAVARSIEVVQQHHTYIPNYSHFDGTNHFRLLESMKDAHLERGFADIAQHFTTFPDGTVGSGRSLNAIPAGIKGANRGAVCIENLGNFDLGRDEITASQRDTIVGLTAVLLKRFGIAADTKGILYHHWFDLNTGERTDGGGVTKSCPGSGFFQGNSVPDCQQHFVPLVRERLRRTQIDDHSVGAAILKIGRVTADRLNVRSGPSSKNQIVDVLRRGIEVKCYEERRNWWRIHSVENLWLYSYYLDEQ